MDYRLKNVYEQMVLRGEKRDTDIKRYHSIGAIYQDIILEAKPLSYKEFAKPETGKRGNRKKLFLDMYKSSKPFKVFKNGVEKSVVFAVDPAVVKQIEGLHVGDPDTNSPAYKQAQSIYNSIRLVSAQDPNDVYLIKDLVKTGEFSGQGSGAGADNTKLNESSVCLWAAVYQETNKATLQDVINNAKKVQRYFNVDENVDAMLQQTDENWLSHYENTAKFLFTNILNEEKYSFHRGSNIVKQVYAKFATFNKQLVEPFANANKWNPADIWALSEHLKESELSKKLDSVKNMNDLNKLLRILYKNKQFIGISLKKTGKTVHSTQYNIDLKKPQAFFGSHNPGLGTKGILSKDVYVGGTYSYLSENDEEYKIQFRSFNPWSDFQGEIKGKHANLGKVAHGILNRILKKNGAEELPSLDKIRNTASDNEKNVPLLKEMHSCFVSLGGNLPDEIKSTKDFVKFVQHSKTISEDYVFSKYFGLKLLKILNNTDEDVRNKIMTDILSYALSSSEFSGPFVKIY